MRASLGDLSSSGQSRRAVTSAVAQLQVEGLRIERWLAGQTDKDHVFDAFEAGTPKARSDAATTAANTIENLAKAASPFATIQPSLIAVFDAKGVVVGRNGSTTMRGDKLYERHPELKKSIDGGQTGSGVWVERSRNEQMLASYAPIRKSGKVIGGVVIGTAFGDARLRNISDDTSKSSLLALIKGKDGMTLIAKSSDPNGDLGNVVSASQKVLASDQVVDLSGVPEGYQGSGRSLGGYGDGKQAVIVALIPLQQVGSFMSLLWPVIGVIFLGLLLTIVAGFIIDSYVSQPISDLEDGLLAVINGQTDLRFELEHPLLGGLVFRVNSLLNQLLGVAEDTTDDEGRPSNAPSPEAFSGALNLDERMAALSFADVDDAQELRDEPPEDYYKRIFDEYIAAKASLGDPTEHIRFAPFSRRIKSSEVQLTNKHGKPFRYRIESQGREVVLLAVPLT
jgi:hypothetical protein